MAFDHPSADDDKLNIDIWENLPIYRAPHPDRNRVRRVRSLPHIGGRNTPPKLPRYPYAHLQGPASARLLHVSYIDRANYIIYGWIQDLASILDAEGEYYALSYTWGSPLVEGFEPDERGRPRFRLILVPHGSEADSVTFPASHETEFPTRHTLYTAHFDLPLTQNLSDFFWTFDLERWSAVVGESLPLWIDSLCINQQDTAEVSQQVLLMGDIYNRCRKTIVWLGPDAKDLCAIEWVLGEAGEALMKLAHPEGGEDGDRDRRKHWLSEKDIMSPAFWHEVGVKVPPIEIHTNTENLRLIAQGMMQEDAETQERISLFLVWMTWCQFFNSRSWFHRAWVMQEAASLPGAYIAVGTLLIPWERLFDMDRSLCWAKHYNTFIAIVAPGFGLEDKIHGPQTDMYLAWYRVLYKLHFPEQVQKSFGGHGNDLFFTVMEFLMRHSWKKKATVAADKYSCILGIAHRTMQKLEIPDNLLDHLVVVNGESASKTFLYLHQVLFDAEPFRALQMLRFVHHASDASMMASPSWIVDWAAAKVPDPLDYGRHKLWDAEINAPQLPTFNIGRDDKMVRIAVSGASLCLDAVPLSKVQLVFPTRITATSHALSAVLGILSLFGPTYAKTGEPLEAALFGAMTASNPANGFDRAQLNMFCDLVANAIIQGIRNQWDNGLTVKHLVSPDGLDYWSLAAPGSSTVASLNLDADDFVGLHTFPEPIPHREKNSTLVAALLRAKKAMSSAIAYLTGGTQKDEVGEIPGFTWTPDVSVEQLALKAYHRRILPGRALLSTDDGFLGLGPGIAQPGDELWLITGRTCPCILRAVPADHAKGGEGKYWFVGEAWVHGLMDGQGVTEENKDSFTEIELI
ncbi:heterokaryon incompatibility protein-domain-containing protein [Podospora conica]|nr:heterokaryon incompatibility protein-domain-containing protein [Schizothecium conicum]